MSKRPKIIEERTIEKSDKSLRYIHNIEALRKKIGCTSYDELKKLGYDVDGYFSRKGEQRNTASVDDYVPTGWKPSVDDYVPTGWEDGVYWGT